MRVIRSLSVLILVGAVAAAASASGQQVAKRATKRAAKEATESAARQAAEDAAKKAAKKAMAPDAVDLNSATPEQLTKIGLDEATVKTVVESRPFSGMDDPKLTAAIPAEALAKLEGKVKVGGAPAAAPAPAADTAQPPAADPAAKPPAS